LFRFINDRIVEIETNTTIAYKLQLQKVLQFWPLDKNLFLLLQSTKIFLARMFKKWRHDIQHNDTQHNNTQHNGIQHNDTQHNGIQHNGIQHKGLICDTRHNDIQHK
jgi:hypothetical protein